MMRAWRWRDEGKLGSTLRLYCSRVGRFYPILQQWRKEVPAKTTWRTAPASMGNDNGKCWPPKRPWQSLAWIIVSPFLPHLERIGARTSEVPWRWRIGTINTQKIDGQVYVGSQCGNLSRHRKHGYSKSTSPPIYLTSRSDFRVEAHLNPLTASPSQPSYTVPSPTTQTN